MLPMINRTAALVILLGLATNSAHAIGWFGKDLRGRACSGGEQHYGPYDYRKPENHGYRLHIVESYHFNKQVEHLIRGMTGSIEGDLNYTLRAFPNHHKALKSIARLSLKKEFLKWDKYPPAECYLQRAIAFTPDDPIVHLIFGIYLHQKHKLQRAKKEYEFAIKYSPKSGLAHYNYGLVLIDLDDIKGAKKQARIAAKLGYPLKGLDKLIKKAEAREALGKDDKAKSKDSDKAKAPSSKVSSGDTKDHPTQDKTASK